MGNYKVGPQKHLTECTMDWSVLQLNRQISACRQNRKQKSVKLEASFKPQLNKFGAVAKADQCLGFCVFETVFHATQVVCEGFFAASMVGMKFVSSCMALRSTFHTHQQFSEI